MGTLFSKLCPNREDSAIVSNKYFEAWQSISRDNRDSLRSQSMSRGDVAARSYQSIDRFYTFEDEWGQKGGFGKVIRAKLKALPSYTYAVKIIKKSDAYTDSFALREVELLKTFDHPNIVSFKEVFQDRLKYYIVLELLEGGDLMRLLEQKGALEENLVIDITWQILLATNYLHSKRIVHGDLKPENFVLAKHGLSKIKMVDFGLSDSLINRDHLSTFAGSKYYMAPEVLDSNYTEKRDLWSVGVIMYQFITGRFPFHSGQDSKLFEQIRKGLLDFSLLEASKYSPQIVSLCKLLLIVNPEERPSASEAINHVMFEKKRAQIRIEGASALTDEMLSHLRDFPGLTSFKQEMIAVIAQSFPNEEYTDTITRVFLAADRSYCGQLSKEDIGALFKQRNIPISEDSLEQIMLKVRIRTKEKITFIEFIAGTLDSSFFTNPDRLREVFNSLDSDGNGYLGVADLNNCLLRVGRCFPLRRIEEMVSDADLNNDREISFEEFLEAMR